MFDENYRSVYVTEHGISIKDDDGKWYDRKPFSIPEEAINFIDAFDCGHEVQPFTFVFSAPGLSI